MLKRGNDRVWPMYFAKKSLDAPRIALKAGQAFPVQDKFYIRGLGYAFGVENPDRVPFNELPYVDVLDVRSQEMVQHILEQGMDFKAAKKFVTAGEAPLDQVAAG